MRKIQWKCVVLFGSAAVVLAAALALLGIFVVTPAVRYAQAEKLVAAGDLAGAYGLLDRLGDYRDAQARKAALQQQVQGAGGVREVSFGGYDWIVLEERDGSSLLLMKNVLEERVYNTVLEPTSWEKCSLRAWLNGSFFQKLPEDARARVAETKVINSGNADANMKSGDKTDDKVFLLSLDEAKLYFVSDAARVALYKGHTAWWWLRTPGLEGIAAATVGSDGAIGTAGSGVNYQNRGVRPALWARLEE
jgi:hypothetical protein